MNELQKAWWKAYNDYLLASPRNCIGLIKGNINVTAAKWHANDVIKALSRLDVEGSKS